MNLVLHREVLIYQSKINSKQVNTYLYFLGQDTLRKWKLIFIPLSKPWIKLENYFIHEYDLKLRFTIDIQVVCQKLQTNKDKNKNLSSLMTGLIKFVPNYQ